MSSHHLELDSKAIEFEKDEMAKMLEREIIEQLQNESASPIIIAPKTTAWCDSVWTAEESTRYRD